MLFVTTPPPCTPAQLSLTFDAENGAYNGMSHSGTLLVLRNLGPDPCTLPGIPTLTFLDRAHQPLNIQRQVPPGMHPGPVIVPVVIAPGAEVTADMRWVSSDAYNAHNCLTPAFLNLTIGSEKIQAPFSATLCGPAGKPPTYTLPPLKPDPVYQPTR